MALTGEQEYELRLKEVALQDQQRKSNLIISIVSAVVALVGTLGAQLIANDKVEGDAEKPEDRPYMLEVANPLDGDQIAGIYIFDPDTGRLWLGRREKDGRLNLVAADPPQNPANATDQKATHSSR